MKLSHYAFAALISFTWMLMTFYPPWIVVHEKNGAGEVRTTAFGNSSIWDPPRAEEHGGIRADIDVNRLLLQYLGSLVPIAGLWYFSSSFRREMEKAEAQENEHLGAQANQSFSRPLRLILCAIAVCCLGASVMLLKDNLSVAAAPPASRLPAR